MVSVFPEATSGGAMHPSRAGLTFWPVGYGTTRRMYIFVNATQLN